MKNSTNATKKLEAKNFRQGERLALPVLTFEGAIFMNRILFLKKFIDEPKKIGSLTPSSKFLARKMLNDLPWENFSHVAELGAGTGIFTEQIIERKTSSCKLLVIEQDFSLRHLLEEKYNNAPPRSNLIFDSFAENLCATLQEINFPPLDCVISGLPFANMEEGLRRQIIENIHRSLKRDGIFVMFQYSLQMKRLLKEYFHSVDINFFLLNFPPAFVYLCKK